MKAKILYTILNIYREKQNIKINYEIKIEKLNLYFINIEKNFEIPLFDIDKDFMYIPDNNVDIILKINSKKILDVISQLFLFGEDLNIFYLKNENEKEYKNYIILKTNEDKAKIKTKININDL